MFYVPPIHDWIIAYVLILLSSIAVSCFLFNLVANRRSYTLLLSVAGLPLWTWLAPLLATYLVLDPSSHGRFEPFKPFLNTTVIGDGIGIMLAAFLPSLAAFHARFVPKPKGLYRTVRKPIPRRSERIA
jgi:hypothetical protein